MNPIPAGLLPALSESLKIDFLPELSFEQLKEKLNFHINHLILHDFQKLVSVLYKVDVDESKVKYLLKENSDTDAAAIIAALIIERQIKKIRSRQEFRKKNDIEEDEKW